MNARVDVVSYDSRDTLRACMAPLASAAFPEFQTSHRRACGTTDGGLRSRVRYVHSSYAARQQGVPWATLKSAKVARLHRRGISGLAFLSGAAGACARSEPRVEDPEFADFVRRELRERPLPFGSR